MGLLNLMKKTLLTLIAALTTALSVSAATFTWGTAQWNLQDGRVYEDIDDLNLEGIVLSYPNPSNYTLTFLQMVAISYDIYVDGATEPIQTGASARQSTVITLDYPWVEGHSYKIVTSGAVLAQANLATYTTDTLSSNSDSYTISFSIKGPELVKTIDVEGTMALTIVDQNWYQTFSLINVAEINKALGINDISEAAVYGLNVNGSYNPNFINPFDGWHDADGGFTVWSGNAGGGVYDLLGHNPYPAVYCIKPNETLDSIFYYFYDYWSDYDPNEPETVPSVGQAKMRRAPQTSYHNVVWDWVDDEGNVTKYKRSYRCDEGTDYKAQFIVLANKKSVLINATLHFVSQEDFAEYLKQLEEQEEKNPYDIDGDGIISVSDITALINIYLGGE